MKKIFIPMVVLVIGLALFLSCGEAGMEEKKEESLVPTEITQICEDHSAGLEYIYYGLIKSGELLNSTEKVKELTVEYFNMMYPEHQNEVIQYVNKTVDELKVYYDKISLAKTTGDTIDNSYILYAIEEMSDSLSEAQVSMLTEIYEISKSPSIEYIISEINDIINNRIPVLPEDERNLLYGTALICQSSSQYWYDNYDEWINLLNTDEALAKASFSWGNVADEDIGTCIKVLGGWTVASWIGVTLPGLGTIAITTAAATVFASGVNALQQVL